MNEKKNTVSFFHDTVLLADKKGDHHSIHFPYHYWDRYLSSFEKIIVSTRSESYEARDLKNRQGYKKSNGEKAIHLPIKNYKNILDLLLKNKKIINEIRNVLENSDYAIIRMPSVIGILACKEALKIKIPFGVEVVSNAFEGYWNYGNIAGKLLAPIIHGATKYYIDKAPVVAYITSEYMQSIYPSKGIAFSDVANISLEIPSDNVISDRMEKLSAINENSLILIGMIGALNSKFKGHQTAIRALKLLLERGVHCKLQIVGEGDSSELVKLCSELEITDNVEFLGTIASGESIFDWMDKLDLYVQPSVTEAHGRAVIEAMSRGIVVVASDVGGLKESLNRTERFKVGDFHEMSNILYDIIKSPDRKLNLSYRNFEYSKKFYKHKIEKNRELFLNGLLNSGNT
ncbi:glycosyltransferase [Paenibacillus sp. FSL H7-0323]|uniref:glycosyltransferase n=1 Tax=Paenibacillus sp. FSL H7-0323 TaxID=2921433 RepID=UPI0030FC4437